ncbi:MAG: sulfotransferase domain-containing protein [Phycisphaerales bacterium JB039]
MPEAPEPTVFHITHWKSGSQWVRAILREAAPDRYIRVASDLSNLKEGEFRPGSVYTPVYLPTYGLRKFVPSPENERRFIIIRDLRDTLVSWYFSVKHSHDATDTEVARTVVPYRTRFNECSEEEGLLIAIHERMGPIADIQRSWLPSGDLVIRYEDMLDDEHLAFEQIFKHCGFDLPDSQRREIVNRYSFESQSGRKRGDEDVAAHHRKGIAGDWKNHFTPLVKSEFKSKFGEILKLTGYEADDCW